MTSATPAAPASDADVAFARSNSLPDSKTPKPESLDQRVSLMRDRREREWRQQRSIRTWVHETVGLANDAATESADGWRIYVFWVRLYGVLHDLRLHWQRVVDKRRQGGLSTEKWVELVATIHEINSSLSEKHRLCIEYRRQWVGHPILNDFRVREIPGGIRDARKSRLVGDREVTMDEYDEVLDAMVRDDDHEGNARDIARAIIPGLRRLFDLTQYAYPFTPLALFVDVEAI